MPRKQEQKSLHEQRADNYVYHFDCWKQAQAYHADFRALMAEKLKYLPAPVLNVWGVGIDTNSISVDDWFRPENFIQYARFSQAYGIPNHLVCAWYWSDGGWSDFQRQWQELPEVVHIPCVQNASCTHLDRESVFSEKLYTKRG